MFQVLKRHPIPIIAHFRDCLVLTYALPTELLTPLLPPGLTIDAYGKWGFVAIALVQTERLRPTGFPVFAGRDFFLAGYRVFARFETATGAKLRGLRILRSDTDRRMMAMFGNLLTHYNYHVARVRIEREAQRLRVRIDTPSGSADLWVTAELSGMPAGLPDGSVFERESDARRFAGPLPYTFDYESQTHSIIRIKGVRANWNPQTVRVSVDRNTFFEQGPFRGSSPILSSAFHTQNIAYRWERGRREALNGNESNGRR